jgi:hypothetical protein
MDNAERKLFLEALKKKRMSNSHPHESKNNQQGFKGVDKNNKSKKIFRRKSGSG